MTDTKEPTPRGDVLKACPFCGGPAELRTANGGIHMYSFGCRIMCEPCGVDITYTGSDLDSFGVRARAIAAWNRRAPILQALTPQAQGCVDD